MKSSPSPPEDAEAAAAIEVAEAAAQVEDQRLKEGIEEALEEERSVWDFLLTKEEDSWLL